MPQDEPSDIRIELRFEKFSAFVEEYAGFLSLGGMFLAIDDDRPVGSLVDFDLKLTDGFRVIQGLGEVIWRRRKAAGPDRPVGLGVRFQALDDGARELILKILEERVRSGLEPFDVEEIPADVLAARDEAPEDKPSTAPPAPEDERSTDPPAPAETSSPPPSPVESSPPLSPAESSPPPAPAESSSPPPAQAASDTGSRPLPDLEKKILGEDGFTLMDAERSRPDAETDKAFEQMSFDAPWGAALPELPEEVLEEASGDAETSGEETPSPSPPASSPPAQDPPAPSPPADSETAVAELDAVLAAAEASSVDPAPADEEARRSLDDSMVLAAEAAAEIDAAPLDEDALDETAFEDIDFSVDAEDAGDQLVVDPDVETDVDFAFDPDPEDQLPPLESVAELDPVDDDPFSEPLPDDESADGVLDEDPTVFTSADAGALDEDATVASGAPPADAEVADFDAPAETSFADLSSQPAPVTDGLPSLDFSETLESPTAPPASPASFAPAQPPVPEPQADSVGESAVADRPVGSEPFTDGSVVDGTVSVGGAPFPVQDYEDDLFADPSGAESGSAVRRALSPKVLAAAGLLLALAGAGYFFRDPIAELLGMSEPPAGTDAPPPVDPAPPAGGLDPLTDGAAQPVAESTGSAIAHDAILETSPPAGEAAVDPPPEPAAVVPPPPASVPTRETATAASTSPSARASRVYRIDWRSESGATRITVRLDGRLEPSRFAHLPLGYAPAREMVKIIGIDEPYVSSYLDVATPQVERIRVGFHPRPGGAELHLVFDYPRVGPRVESVENLGDRLEVLIVGP